MKPRSSNTARSRRLRAVTLPVVGDVVPLTLDEIALEPQSVRRLTSEQAQQLYVHCAAVLGVLREHCRSPLLPSAGDRALTAAEVAELVGLSQSWVEHHQQDLPPRRSIAGTPRWLLSEIEAWLKRTARYGDAS